MGGFLSERPKVFVSSTSEFADVRAELRDEFSGVLDLTLNENVDAHGERPRDWCERMIGSSKLFVAIIGHEFGSELPGDAENRSIVQWEVQLAEGRLGRRAMKVFVRRLTDDDAADPRQRRFVEDVTDFDEGHYCKVFGEMAEAPGIIRKSLTKWFRDLMAGVIRGASSFQKSVRLIAAILLGLGLAGSVAVGLPVVRDDLTTNSVVAILIALGIMTVSAVVLLSREAKP